MEADRSRGPILAMGHAAAAVAKYCGAAACAIARRQLRVGDTLQEWRERRQQRGSLGRMTDFMLKDIGLSRGDAHREIAKRFWEE